MAKNTDRGARELFSVHPDILREAAAYRRVPRRSSEPKQPDVEAGQQDAGRPAGTS